MKNHVHSEVFYIRKQKAMTKKNKASTQSNFHIMATDATCHVSV